MSLQAGWWRAAWPALALGTLLSLPWLSNALFLDDWHVLWQAAQAPWTPQGLARGFTFLDASSIEVWNLSTGPAYHYFRPLVVASYKLDLALWGPAPLPSHLLNLVCHLLSTSLVVWLGLRLGASQGAARLAGLLFAIQPQSHVAIHWTSGRTETLAGLFVLAGLAAHVKARQDRRPLWLLATLAALALAALSKESAVLLPAGVLIFEAVRVSSQGWPSRKQLLTALAWSAPVLVAGLLFVGFRLLLWDPGASLGPPYLHSPLQAGFLSHALAKTAYNLVALATTFLLVPLFGVEWLVHHPLALAALVALAVGLYALILRRAWPHPLGRLGALWLAVALLPTLPLLTVDLYLYLASAGLAWMLGVALSGRQDGPGPAPLWLRIGLVALFALGFCLRGVLYRIEGQVSERIVQDVRSDPPLEPGDRLLLVNMPVAASHLASTLRLRGGPADTRVTLVSVSPQWTLPTETPQVRCLDSTHVRVLPNEGRQAFFETSEEVALQLLRQPFDPHRSYDADGLTITPVVEEGRVVALDLVLDQPLDQGTFRIYAFQDQGRLAHRVCQ